MHVTGLFCGGVGQGYHQATKRRSLRRAGYESAQQCGLCASSTPIVMWKLPSQGIAP